MHLFTLALVFTLLLGCSRNDTTGSTSDKLSGTIDVFSEPVFRVQVPDRVIDALSNHSKSQARRFVDESRRLTSLTKVFLNDPTLKHQIKLQEQWQRTHLAFTSAQLGLVATDDSASETRALKARIETWPIQPGFIDNLPDYPFSGVVFDKTLEITIENLLIQHGFTDDEEVLLGLHSLEFLIFERDFIDFTAQENEWKDRRRELLHLITEQLLTDASEFDQRVNGFFDRDISNELVVNFLLKEALAKTRLASTASNLFAAQEIGHCLSSDRSLTILAEEINGLHQFLITEVPLSSTLNQVSPETFGNFTITIDKLVTTIGEANSNEVSRANLPLLLSALTHQMEFFSQGFQPVYPN